MSDAIRGISALLICLLICGATDEAPRYLTVTSQGYSRFEISEGHVVAFYTDGVECEYLGFEIAAGVLRYDQATNVADLSEGVRFTVPFGDSLLTAYCDSIVLDGQQGEAYTDVVLKGTLDEPPIAFTAGLARVSFPPGTALTLGGGSQAEEGSAMTLSLGQGVAITTEHQSLLTCEGLVLDGQSRQISTQGAFEIKANLGQQTIPGDSQQFDLTELKISGQQLSGVLSEEAGMASAQVMAPLIETTNLTVAADWAEIVDTSPTGTDAGFWHSWSAAVTGSPLLVSVSSEELELELTAGQAELRGTVDGLQGCRFADSVKLRYGDTSLTTPELVVEVENEVLALNMPEGFKAGFDLSQVSEMEPIELSEVAGWAKR